MKSWQHLHNRSRAGGRATVRLVLLVALGLALAAGGFWLRGRGLGGPGGLGEGWGPEAARPSPLPAGEPAGTAGPTPVDEPAPARDEASGRALAPGRSPAESDWHWGLGIGAPQTEAPIWTIRLQPVHPDGIELGGIDAHVVRRGYDAHQVTQQWRGHLPVQAGEPVELRVSGSAMAVLRAQLWIATDAAALEALDGRILRATPPARAGTRIDLAAARSVDEEARVIELGPVVLAYPKPIGTVSLGGLWQDPVRLFVRGPAPPHPVFHDSRHSRSFDLPESQRTLSVAAFLQQVDAETASWSVTAESPRDDRAWSGPVTGKAPLGAPIHLDAPVPVGLELALDVGAHPRASRIVITDLAAGADSPPLPGPGGALDEEAYRALLARARWTAVVPQAIVKSGRDRYDLGFVAFGDGPIHIEVWSVRDGDGLRSRLLSTRVIVRGYVLPVLLR